MIRQLRNYSLFIFFLSCVLYPLAFATHSVHLWGSVSFKSMEAEESNIPGLTIFVKADGEILAHTSVDQNCNYTISFLPKKQSTFDFYYTGNDFDTTFIKSFTFFESNAMQWDIQL